MSGAADHYSYVPTLEKGDVAALEEPDSSSWQRQAGPSPMKEAKEKLQQVHRQLGSVKSLSGKRSAKPTGLADLQHSAGPTRSKPAAASSTPPAAYDPAEVPEDWKSSLFEAAQQKCSTGGTAAGTAADRAFGGFQATRCSPAAAAAAAASAQQQPSGGIASQSGLAEDKENKGRGVSEAASVVSQDAEGTQVKLMGTISFDADYVPGEAPSPRITSQVAPRTDAVVSPLDPQHSKVAESNKAQRQFFASELHAAVLAQHCSRLRQLKHMGADLSEWNKDGQGPLHVAADLGNTKVVRTLMQLGADKDSRDKNGDTPLQLAICGGGYDQRGKMDSMELLISHGANVELPNREGRTPLHTAARTGHIQALIRLLNAGAHRAPTDRDGYRPVDLAVGGHHTDIVEYLNDVDTAVQYTKIAQYSKYL